MPQGTSYWYFINSLIISSHKNETIVASTHINLYNCRKKQTPESFPHSSSAICPDLLDTKKTPPKTKKTPATTLLFPLAQSSTKQVTANAGSTVSIKFLANLGSSNYKTAKRYTRPANKIPMASKERTSQENTRFGFPSEEGEKEGRWISTWNKFIK